MYVLLCVYVIKPYSFGSPLSQALFVLSCLHCVSVCALVAISSFEHVSYSHQTICTYITSKLTPFESVKCIIMLHLLCYDFMMFTHA